MNTLRERVQLLIPILEDQSKRYDQIACNQAFAEWQRHFEGKAEAYREIVVYIRDALKE